MSKKLDSKVVAMNPEELVVGQIYPIYGMVTSILEESDTLFTVVINFDYKATMKPLPELKDVIKNRLYQPGIFMSKLTAKNDVGCIPLEKKPDTTTTFPFELEVQTSLFDSKRPGPDGTIIKDEPYAIASGEKINLTPETESNLFDKVLKNYSPQKQSTETIAPDNEAKDSLLSRLSNAFIELKNTITFTREKLVNKPNTALTIDILSRLDAYESMAKKQENLLDELKVALDTGNADETRLLTSRITSLSIFIRDDVQSLLFNSVPTDDELH